MTVTPDDRPTCKHGCIVGGRRDWRHGGSAPTAVHVQVGERMSELVGDERVEQRVETAVDVEDESGDWRDVHVHVEVSVVDGAAPLLPLDAHVVRQHAQRERDDERRQQPDHLAPRRQQVVAAAGQLGRR